MSEYGLFSCKSIVVTKSEISIDSTIHGYKSVVSQLIGKRRDVLWETFDGLTGVFSRSKDIDVKEAQMY